VRAAPATIGSIRRFVAAAVTAAVLASAPAAGAQEPAIDSVDPPISTTELQSLSCLGTGSLTAGWAAVLVILSPLEALSAPVIAAAFAAGCGVGAVAAPGVRWLIRYVKGETATGTP